MHNSWMVSRFLARVAPALYHGRQRASKQRQGVCMPRRMALEEINGLDRGGFVAALGPLFEGSPWIAAETWPARPFAGVTDLHDALCRTMRQAPVERQVALIRAHPDRVGRSALAGTLTPESAGEQASAGLARLSPDEVATFARLNAAYRDRFGFPFVICARENKKGSILAGFDARLHNSREQEIEIALGEVAKICWHRLIDLAGSDA